jgi:phytanoyl-CoA hydroxylase
MTQPLLLLSTGIFKHAQTGGEVVPHQDSAHLYTEPPSCLGLQDADIENGCLSAVLGGHHSPVTSRYRRHPKGVARFDPPGLPAFPEAAFQPLPAHRRSLVLLHG